MTAPVRRTDARGDSRGGSAPDLGEEGRPSLGERLALRNWSLPVKLAAVLLVPTLFVITLGVLRIVEQTDKASSYDGVQQAVALENRNASLLSALDVERRAAAVLLAGALVVPVARASTARNAAPDAARANGRIAFSTGVVLHDSGDTGQPHPFPYASHGPSLLPKLPWWMRTRRRSTARWPKPGPATSGCSAGTRDPTGRSRR